MREHDALSALAISFRLRELARRWDESRLQVLRDTLEALNSAPLLPSETVIRSFTGDLLASDLRDEFAQEIFVFGATDYDLSRFELTALGPGQTACDVGAHIGYHTQLMARAVGSEGRVFAFEPTPRTFGYLSRNTGWLPQVTLQNSAVGEVGNTIEFFDYGQRLAAYNSRYGIRIEAGDARIDTDPLTLTVQQQCLDDIFAESERKPDYVKIDAESAEMDVLRGMEAILHTARPTIALEVGDFPHLIKNGVPSTIQLVDHLGTRGYRPFEFVEGNLRPHKVSLDKPYGYMNLIFINLESDSPGSDLLYR